MNEIEDLSIIPGPVKVTIVHSNGEEEEIEGADYGDIYERVYNLGERVEFKRPSARRWYDWWRRRREKQGKRFKEV